ncbi:nuclear apoptosis-inducing factor 1-like [Mugil cephalus]|uniref:nuclear apoptosis-inducing factor 1-like n=1 Tax=Mugil cephalus TaxID=48193 RepID=UPI001FB820E6|nr:nuclear apoptosis-inducing factor 1-like [Mugil cephalus]
MLKRIKKKKNFSPGEIETLLLNVSLRKKILFSSVRCGVSSPVKRQAWQDITRAVNAVGTEQRTVGEVKKKWSDMKTEAKKRLAAAGRSDTGTERGQEVRATHVDERIGAIIGGVCLSGLRSDHQDNQDNELPQPENKYPTVLGIKIEDIKTEPPLPSSEDIDTAVSSSPSTSQIQSGPSGGSDTGSLLQVQQKILECLQHMAGTFSQINNTLKELNDTLKNLK